MSKPKRHLPPLDEWQLYTLQRGLECYIDVLLAEPLPPVESADLIYSARVEAVQQLRDLINTIRFPNRNQTKRRSKKDVPNTGP